MSEVDGEPLGSGRSPKIFCTVGSIVSPVRLLGLATEVRSTATGSCAPVAGLMEKPVKVPFLKFCVGNSEDFVRVVRNLWYSLLMKKNVRFLRIGPPTENPKSLRTYGF